MKIANRKSKGRGLEYSVWDSLRPFIEDIRLMSQLGCPQQYDLITESAQQVIECKRHKNFSWNELRKYFDKLESVMPVDYSAVLVFQANRQPALVMARNMNNEISVRTFNDYFEIEFMKHKGVNNGNK